jgi:hypothetical protein
LAPDAPLIARSDGTRTTPRSISYARRRNAALIRAGNAVNISMCKATGDFFRSWGMPGSRFVPSPPAVESDDLYAQGGSVL